MFDDKNGPIECFTWGKFIVCGKEHGIAAENNIGCGKDIRIIGAEVSRWGERKGHLLDKAMITGVFDLDINILVIGTGVNEKLVCPIEVENYILKNGIKQLILRNTPEACNIYNALYNKGEKVALLAHGTC